jgi:hypothetical protein
MTTAAYFAATFLLGVAAGLCWERWMSRRDRADARAREAFLEWDRDEWMKACRASEERARVAHNERMNFWMAHRARLSEREVN